MKKQTIRIFALVLVVVMLWSLVACDATRKAPATTTPEVTEPEATEPEATEPEATEPEATEPEATEPEETEPEETEPEATEPEAAELEFYTGNELNAGNFEVHSVTYRDLDNGYVRIAVDVTTSEEMTFSIWPTYSDDIVMNGIVAEGRQTVTCDLLEADAMAAEWFSMRFDCSYEGGRFFLDFSILRKKLAVTDGKPVGEAEELGFSVDSNLKTESVEVHSVTCRDLDNGYVRLAVDFTAREGLSISVFDSHSELFNFRGGSTAEGRQTITYDLLKKDAMAAQFIVMRFFRSNEDGSTDWLSLYFNLSEKKPVITDGKPVGEAVELDFSVDNNLQIGNFEVHSVTYRDLDNGYIRITVDCTVSEGLSFTAFNPPSGELFAFTGGPTVEGRQTITYDWLKEDAMAVKNITMSFYGSGNDGGAYLFYNLIRTKMKTTDGKPVGEAMELDFSVDNHLKTGSVEVHSVTCRRLDNGYVRIAVDCTTSEEMPTSAYDIPFEVYFLLIGDLTVEGRQTITYDLLAEDVQSIEAVEMRFKYDNSDTVFVRFDPNASFDVTP